VFSHLGHLLRLPTATEPILLLRFHHLRLLRMVFLGTSKITGVRSLGIQNPLCLISAPTGHVVLVLLGLFNEKPSPLTWVMTGIGLLLAALALWEKGPCSSGFLWNLTRSRSASGGPVQARQSPHSVFLSRGLYPVYLPHPLKAGAFQGRRQVLIPVIMGLLIWFLEGLTTRCSPQG